MSDAGAFAQLGLAAVMGDRPEPARPPSPQGNTLVAGDLSLLDPVIRDSERHRYRPANKQE